MIEIGETPKKISVIGGAGFVGTYFCDRLMEEGILFEILDLTESQKYPEQTKICDVRDKIRLEHSVTGDVVVNLAAIHRDDVTDKDAYYRTNVLGAINVAQVCKKKKIKKLVFISSVAVYGFAPPETDETGELEPFNEYGHTKLLAEREYNARYADDSNRLIIVRPTVIFGPGNRGNVFNLLNSIAKKRFLLVGNGSNKKSIAYVENVSAFLLWAIKHQSCHSVTNYIDKPDLTMRELVDFTRKTLGYGRGYRLRIPYCMGLLMGYVFDYLTSLTGRTYPISSIRIRKFCATTSFSSRTEFKPPVNLTYGLEKTIKQEFIEDRNLVTFETE